MKQRDRHQLYEEAVQNPELMVDFLAHLYESCTDSLPTVLREDFCGTAYLAATWAAQAAQHRAIAVDADAEIIEYAKQHTLQQIGEAKNRVQLIPQDVLACAEKADIIVSLNFSHFIYKSREQLLAYFQHARQCLRPSGLFVCDVYGGPTSLAIGTDERSCGSFVYQWQQASYNPLTAEVVNHIHFRFPDGTDIEHAFTYDWRLWSIVELRELLHEAGFTQDRVCYEVEDGFDDEVDTSELEAWVAYIVACE